MSISSKITRQTTVTNFESLNAIAVDLSTKNLDLYFVISLAWKLFTAFYPQTNVQIKLPNNTMDFYPNLSSTISWCKKNSVLNYANSRLYSFQDHIITTHSVTIDIFYKENLASCSKFKTADKLSNNLTDTIFLLVIVNHFTPDL